MKYHPARLSGLLLSTCFLIAAADTTPGSLHGELQRLDLDLEAALHALVCATDAGRPLVDSAAEADRFEANLQFLEEQARRQPSVDEAARRKLHVLRNRVGDLRKIADGGVAPSPTARYCGEAAAVRVGGTHQGGPPNDDCADAITIGLGSFVGDISLATNDGEAACGASLFSPDVWFRYVAEETERIYLDTVGSSYDTVLSIHSACPGTVGNSLGCNDDTLGLDSAVSLLALAGSEHWIRVSGFDGATGPFALNVGAGGEISGVVTDAATGDPLSGVFVDLWDESGFYEGTQVTAANGSYTFGDLHPGIYFVSTAGARPHVDELYDDIPCPQLLTVDCAVTDGTPIQVAVETAVSGIDFALDLGGAFTGTVTETGTGSGVAGASVRIIDAAGQRATTAFTDLAGFYRAEGLPTGTYFAVAEDDDFIEQLYDGLSCPGGPPLGCDPASGAAIDVSLGATTPGIDFVLDRLGAISGTVTSSATGDPLPSIRIEIRRANGTFARSATTDGSGVYSVGGLDAGTYFVVAESFTDYRDELYMDLPCPGGAPFGCNVSDGEGVPVSLNATVSGVDFALERLGTITGIVTELGSGDSLPSVSVRIWDTNGFLESSVFTDSSGSFIADRLAAGTYFATAADSDYLDEIYDDLPCPGGVFVCDPTTGTPIAVSLDATTAGIDFELARLGAISGVVTDDATGDPVPFSRVEIWRADGSFAISTLLDGSGGYRVDGLEAGTYFVTTDASASGYLDELYDDLPCLGGATVGCDPTDGSPVAVSLGATTAGIDFALGSGGVITGSVTDATTGDPISSVLVAIYDTEGRYVDDDRPDSSGVYRLGGLISGTYFALVHPFNSNYGNEIYDDLPCIPGACDPTTGTAIAVSLGATTSGIDFALERRGAISGTVTDAATGAPVSAGRVRVWNASGNSVGSDFLDSSGSYSVGGLEAGTYFAATDLFDGGYVDELFEDLPCGSGCVPTTGTPIMVSLGAVTSGIDFTLERNGAISGIVTLSSTGEPVSGLRVEAFGSAGTFANATTTGASGIYTLSNLGPGTYFVLTEGRAVLDELFEDLPCEDGCDPTQGTPIPVALNATTRHIDLALDLAGSISGTVTDDLGAPISGGIRVRILDADGVQLRSVSTDYLGRYTADDLLEGAHYAATSSSGYVDELYDDVPCSGACDPTDGGNPIVVEINSPVTGIDFALDRRGAIAGTATDEMTGQPISGLRIEVWDSEEDFVTSRTTNSAGEYLLPDLLPDRYYVSTNSSQGYLDELYDDLPCLSGVPFGCDADKGDAIQAVVNTTTTGIDFALIPTSTGLSGSVRAEETGEALANVFVDVWAADGTHVTTAVTNAEGDYFEGLPPGSYYVTTDNGADLVDEVFDGVACPGPAFAGLCDPLAGTPVVVSESSSSGAPGFTTGVDFTLETATLYEDGFESGDLSAWSSAVGEAP
ncbi:MAG: hypothetical protein GY719_13650 [bacterium]|nr:hypothetical protein [bacterium]